MPSNNDKKKYNATCAICGKPYHMCYSCKKNDKTLVWKRFCCCPEHYKIYQLVHGYTTGLYTGAEANKKLANIDLSDLDELRPNIKEIVKKIRSLGVRKAKKPVANDVEATVATTKDDDMSDAKVGHVIPEPLPAVATMSSAAPEKAEDVSVSMDN